MDNQVAVKAIIQNEEGKFLIVREGKRWQAVGGRLDKGEKLADGLRRETKEETGITDLKIGKVIHVDEWFAKPEGELKHIVALFYSCKTTANTAVLSNEHQAYAWVSVDELEEFGDTIEPELRIAIQLAGQQA